MTDPTAQAAPGWYPVAPGSSQLRWWDGTQWTDHVHDTARDGIGYAATAIPKAPEGTDPNTVFGWLIPLTPLLSTVSVPIYFATIGGALADFAQRVTNDPRDPQAVLGFYGAIFSPTYFAVLVLGLAAYVLAVVFGYQDWKALNRKGVPRPFHWAWGFLSAPLVYIIGRSVIVHRRTGKGLGPLWVLIAVTVVNFIVVFVGYALAFGPFLSTIGQLGTTSVGP